MTREERVRYANMIHKEGKYTIGTIPFNKRLKAWFTKGGNISRSRIDKWVNKWKTL